MTKPEHIEELQVTPEPLQATLEPLQVTPPEQPLQAALEPFGEPLSDKPNRKNKSRNSRDSVAKKAIRDFLRSSHHWHSEAEIFKACRWALPNDDKVGRDLVHRTITQNPKVIKYRKDGDKKATLVASTRDGLVQYDADID